MIFSRKTKVATVSPEDAAALSKAGAVILDVREAGEWAAGHAPNAMHVPLARVMDSVSGLADKEVLTVCRSGRRSNQAAAVLAKAGIKVRNVPGGMKSWEAAGLPVVRDNGASGTVA